MSRIIDNDYFRRWIGEQRVALIFEATRIDIEWSPRFLSLFYWFICLFFYEPDGTALITSPGMAGIDQIDEQLNLTARSSFDFLFGFEFDAVSGYVAAATPSTSSTCRDGPAYSTTAGLGASRQCHPSEGDGSFF